MAWKSIEELSRSCCRNRRPIRRSPTRQVLVDLPNFFGNTFGVSRNAKPAESDERRPLYLQASLTSSMNAAMLDNRRGTGWENFAVCKLSMWEKIHSKENNKNTIANTILLCRHFVHLTIWPFWPVFSRETCGFRSWTARFRLVPPTRNTRVLPLRFTRANVHMISGGTVQEVITRLKAWWLSAF